LSKLEKMQLELDMETREHFEKQILRMTRELGCMSHEEPRGSDMLYLMQAPVFDLGVGSRSGAAAGHDPTAVCSVLPEEAGNWERFEASSFEPGFSIQIGFHGGNPGHQTGTPTD
jgi:hypothetical protein